MHSCHYHEFCVYPAIVFTTYRTVYHILYKSCMNALIFHIIVYLIFSSYSMFFQPIHVIIYCSSIFNPVQSSIVRMYHICPFICCWKCMPLRAIIILQWTFLHISSGKHVQEVLKGIMPKNKIPGCWSIHIFKLTFFSN